jgi:hypothetical protein
MTFVATTGELARVVIAPHGAALLALEQALRSA